MQLAAVGEVAPAVSLGCTFVGVAAAAGALEQELDRPQRNSAPSAVQTRETQLEAAFSPADARVRRAATAVTTRMCSPHVSLTHFDSPHAAY